MQRRPDGFPRRGDKLLWTPAERAIFDAIQAVESAGTHPLLTEAVILLGKAQNKTADFVELPPPIPFSHCQPRRYRKRPISVTAVRFDPLGPHLLVLPEGVEGIPRREGGNWAQPDCTFYVTTIQGQRIEVKRGEWIITEADAIHHYPCAAEEFERVYELENGDGAG